MKIIKSNRKNNTYSLEIEVSSEAMVAGMDDAFKRVVKNVKVPGFRKGRVPRNVYEKNFGRDALVRESVVSVINDAYTQAIAELEIDPIDNPRNIDISEYKENEPVIFKCDVDVKPEVKLGKYKGVKIKAAKSDVTDKDIDADIENLLNKHIEYKPVERGIKEDDIVRFHGKGSANGDAIESLTRENMAAKIGEGTYTETFDTEITGLKKGETKSFELSFPDDYISPDLRNKTVTMEVTIDEVSEKQAPELNDEFIKKAANVDTLDQYKKDTRDRLEASADEAHKTEVKALIIDEVSKNSKFELPPVMVENEIDQSIRSFEMQLRQSGLAIDNYLQMANKSKDELRDELRESSEKRVVTSLILEAIAEKESIQPTEDELNVEIKKWNLPNVSSIHDVKNNPGFDLNVLQSFVKEQKAYDLLIDNAKIS